MEKEGLVQRFEYTFELSWKTLRDYLEAKEVIVKFPRDVIKESFRYELIQDGDTWMAMLESRYKLTHTYDEKHYNDALHELKGDYYEAITQVYQHLHCCFEEEHEG